MGSSRIVAGLKSPGRASSLRCATSCHVRPKMRSFSRSRMAGSRYISEGRVDARATSVSSFAMPEHCRSVASLAIVNGKVWQRPDSNLVVVDGERITGVGTGRVTADRVLDAGGASILPAFNDAHVHFLMASRSLGELDLHGVDDQTEIERRIVEYARTRAGPWVVGRGWFYSAFAGGMPTLELLDRLVPDRPAYIESFDAHTRRSPGRRTTTLIEEKRVAQMGTFNGNPLTMAASRATLLEILDTNAYAHFDALAETLQGGLDEAIAPGAISTPRLD